MATSFRFKLRRGLAAEWAAVNPVLMDGEPGVETDTGGLKLGNGTTPWNDLDYSGYRLAEILAAAAEEAEEQVTALEEGLEAHITTVQSLLGERITAVENAPALKPLAPAAGADVNTLTTRATYDVATDTLAGSLANLPVVATGVLEVETTATGVVFQSFHASGAEGGLFYRHTLATDPLTFSGWVNLLTAGSGMVEVLLTADATDPGTFIAAGGGSSTLVGLNDVDATGVSDGQVLSWDESTGLWVPAHGGTGGGAAGAAVYAGWFPSLSSVIYPYTSGTSPTYFARFQAVADAVMTRLGFRLTVTAGNRYRFTVVRFTGGYKSEGDMVEVQDVLAEVTVTATASQAGQGVALTVDLDQDVVLHAGRNYAVAITGLDQDVVVPMWHHYSGSATIGPIMLHDSDNEWIGGELPEKSLTVGQMIPEGYDGYPSFGFRAVLTAEGGASGGGATILDALDDVDTSTVAPTSGQGLVFRAGQWRPGTPNATLSGLTDVNLAGVTAGQTLLYQDGVWRAGPAGAPAAEGSMVWRGQWVAGTTYAAGDVVSHGGQLWVATSPGATAPTAGGAVEEPVEGPGGGPVAGVTSVPWNYDWEWETPAPDQWWSYHAATPIDPPWSFFDGEPVSYNSRETGTWPGKPNTANYLAIYPSEPPFDAADQTFHPHTARLAVTFDKNAVLSFWDAYSAPARPGDYVAFTVNGTEIHRTAHDANATAWNGLGYQRQPWTRHTYNVVANTPYVFEWTYHTAAPRISNGPYNMFWLAGVQATIDGVESPYPNPYATAWRDDFTSWETRSPHWHVLEEISYAEGRAQGFLRGWPSRIMASYEATANQPGSARDGTGVWTDIRVNMLPEELDPHLIVNENRATQELYHYRPRDGALLRYNPDSGYTTLGTVTGATLTGGATVTITANNGAFTIQQVDGAGTHTGTFTDPNPIKGGGWGINFGYNSGGDAAAVASYDSFSWAPIGSSQPGLMQATNTGSLRAATTEPIVGQWLPLGSAAPAATTLDALTDVNTSGYTPTDGQALTWDAEIGLWRPSTIGGAGSGGMFWKGDYSNATTYEYGDVARTADGLFVALQQVVGAAPALPMDPFVDTFTRTTLGPTWTVNTDSKWTISNGKAISSGNTFTALVNTNLTPDGKVTVTNLGAQSNSVHYVVFGWVDSLNYYRLALGSYGGGGGRIQKVVNGTATTLVSTPAGSDYMTGYQNMAGVVVTKTGGQLTASFPTHQRGQVELTYSDPNPLNGTGWGVASHMWSTDRMTVDTFKFEPAQNTRWSVIERRWAMDSLTDVQAETPADGQTLAFNAATATWLPTDFPAGGEAGGPGTMVWRGPWDVNTAYVYGDVTTTTQGIFVALTSTTGTTPAVPIDAFSDAFDRPNGPLGPAWDVVEGSWAVVGGKASIEELTPNTLGSKILKHLSPDGTLSLRVTTEYPTMQNTSVLIGWTDGQNHYRYNVKDRTLSRVGGGTATTVATAVNANIASTESRITVTKTAGRIQITHLSSSQTFTIDWTDPTPITGPSWGVVHAAFNNSTAGDNSTVDDFTFTPAPATVWGVVERKWAIKNMQDVNAPAATTGQVLTYNGASGKWEPATPVAGGTGGSARTGTMVWNGPWSTGTSYVYGDVVTHSGMLWVANTANAAVTPALPGLAFSDDFERPDGPIGQFWDEVNPSWSIVGGKARNSSRENSNQNLLRTGLASDGTAVWRDVSMDNPVQNSSLVIARVDGNNQYLFYPRAGWVRKIANGVTTDLGQVKNPLGNAFSGTGFTSVTVTKSGGTITVTAIADGTANGSFTGTFTDATPITGTTWGIRHLLYSNVVGGADITTVGSFAFTPRTDSPWNILERRWSTTSLDDVFAPTVLHGQTLLWNATASRWEPGTPSGGGGGGAAVTEVPNRPGIYSIS